ncbi:putative polyketide synthase [Xylaria flabelliformis]|nr:putative polyketide synthase [Xylaria flabelliformis]
MQSASQEGIQPVTLASSGSGAIAIVGMGCRWPGGVRNLSQLWDLLKEGRDGWTRFQPDKINLDGFYHPNGQRPGSMFTEGAHLLQEDPRLFDHGFFGITAAEAISMDPSQRKLLEVAYEAFENAGEPWHKVSGSKTGVFIGNFNNDHQVMQFRDLDYPLPYAVTGGGATILSNRISYVFNLRGPSMVIDTACSASMYALHLAILSLKNGDCDAAIVASGNLILNPDAQLFTTKLNAISPTSRSHTFDAAADGYSRAEGVGAIYIKRLTDALANGDPIRAVVRGTSYSGISHPSPDGQESVIRQAYKAADLDISGTGYFECHGTGTPVGDPIEVAAIGRVFAKVHQDEPLLIGSIKPNLGHSEPASALAQIMKAVLSMEHGEIPATIGVRRLNPAIDFDKTRTKVVTNMTPWPSTRLRRVSINSFGYGGANAHCVLDHPSVILPNYQLRGLPLSSHQSLSRTQQAEPRLKYEVCQLPQADTQHSHSFNWWKTPKFTHMEDTGVRALALVALSAHDEQALGTSIEMIPELIYKYNLCDLLYTLGARRSLFSHRGFAVIRSGLLDDDVEAIPMTTRKAPHSPSQKICFIFTGQGAQWPTMGAKLIHEFWVFRQTIRYLDFVLGHLRERPSWKIENLLQEPATTSRIHEPAFAQTVSTALQIALVNLLGLWGIQPSVTIGHSSGEIAAAYAAGRLRASEAIVVAYSRGQVVSSNQQDGLMIAVGLGPNEIRPYIVGLENRVQVAAFNSPKSMTLSGDDEVIRQLAARFTEQNVFNRILKTGHNAYHSHHMSSLGETYEQQIKNGLGVINLIKSDPRRPHTTWISTVCPEDRADANHPRYWRQNLESPVRFSDAISMLGKDITTDLLIEIGPHPALAGPLRQLRTDSATTLPPYLGSLQRGQDDVISMLNLAGQLFLHNACIDLAAVNAVERLHGGDLQLCYGYPCVDMPQYSFSYPEKALYLENRFNRELRQRRYLRHDLLGSRQPGGSSSHPSWRNILRVKDLPWLNDHKLIPHSVLPAAAYITMAIEAARQIYGEQASSEQVDSSPIRSYKLRTVVINATLKLEDSEHGVETVLSMEKVALATSSTSPVWYRFNIGSMPVEGAATWTEHCSGMISVVTRDTVIHRSNRLHKDPHSRLLDVDRWYDKLQEVGLGYGPSFRCLSKLQAYRGTRSAAADVILDSTAGVIIGGESIYALHPAAIDACLQLALISLHSGQVESVKSAFVPVFLDNISLWVSNPSEKRGRAVATGRFEGQRSAYTQAQLFTISGRPLLDIGELKCVVFDGTRGSKVFPQLAREPYWKTVSMVDIDSFTNEHAQIMFRPMDSCGLPLKELDELCRSILVDMDRRRIKHQAAMEILHPNPFEAWIQANNAHATCHEISEIHSDELQANIMRLFSQLGHTHEGRCIERIYNNMEHLFHEETNLPELMTDNYHLDELYTTGVIAVGAKAQLQHLVNIHAHKNPRMRILELGGGTGGSTTAVLDTLLSKTYFRRFEGYTFTDSTEWCVANAQTMLAGHSGITFQVFDIEHDPEVQGFAPGSFDLVIAARSLGRSVNVATALRNIYSVLRSGGSLIFTELMHKRLSLDMLSRSFTGFWDEEHRIRDASEWNRSLTDSGFLSAQVMLDDYAGEEAMLTTILTRKSSTPEYDIHLSPQPLQNIYLVYRDYLPPLAAYIHEAFKTSAFRCIYKNLFAHDEIPVGSCVISLVDHDDSTLLRSGPEHFQAIQALVAKASVLVWVATRNSAGSNIETAVMKGILRSVATENILLNVAYIEVCSPSLHHPARTTELITFKLLQMQSCKPLGIIDRECLLQNGTFFIERLVPEVGLNQLFRFHHRLEEVVQETLIDHEQAIKPTYKHPGLLSSLYFEPDQSLSGPLKEDWVQIKMEAIGLNMKDIAIATAKFDSNYQSHEGAGIVCQVGSSVTSFNKGDHVFGLVLGNMGTYIRCPTHLICKVPNGESSIAAASMPISYLAAIYALHRLARLEKGESVLIESAAGSLGIAAIRIARHLGAVIYATVGSSEKESFLVDKFSLEPFRIFRSRETNLPEEIMRKTGGKGIDVILSTSQGETMHEIWRCIAPFGRFIDLGRTAVLSFEKLSLEVFKRNATFTSFDLTDVALKKPQIIEQLMAELKDLWKNGVIGPISPITCFELSQLTSAMTFFTKGRHIGKVVIQIDKSTRPANVLRNVTYNHFDPDAAYLLVGCLGGLGRTLSVWMVERGARHIMFLSRSTTKTPEVKLLLDRLVGMGASPEIFGCDITEYSTLASTVAQISSKRSLKGLIHAAMVEGDSLFNHTTYPQVQAVLAPKVKGTINLHQVCQHHPLDFFLMTSSLVGVIGTATQSAYCAANVFQNDFARQCLSQGFPAISLDLGLILEIGSVGHAKNVQQSLQRVATYGQSETEFLQLVEGALFVVQDARSPKPIADHGGHIITGLEPGRFLAHLDGRPMTDFVWHKNARFQSVVQAISDRVRSCSTVKSVAAGGNDSVKVRLEAAVSPQEKIAVIQTAVTVSLSELLGLAADEIDINKAMSHYGLDSLVAAELRNWLVVNLGVEATTLQLLSEIATVTNLANMAIEGLYGKTKS